MPFDLNLETIFFLVVLVLTFLYQMYKRFAEPKEKLEPYSETEERQPQHSFEPFDGFAPFGERQDPFGEPVVSEKESPPQAQKIVVVDLPQPPKAPSSAARTFAKQTRPQPTKSTQSAQSANPKNTAIEKRWTHKTPWQRAFIYSEVLGSCKAFKEAREQP